jgi:hypothetical protein
VAALLSRLSVKPFFEQYFKADEYARQILKAGEDLSDFVQIFEVSSYSKSLCGADCPASNTD